MHSVTNKPIDARIMHGHRRRRSRRHRSRLDSAIEEYLGEVQARRSVEAAERLRVLFDDFRQSCMRAYLHSITRRDLILYIGVLRERGLADRPIFNRASTLLTVCSEFFPRSC
jgi:hypothetical protein